MSRNLPILLCPLLIGVLAWFLHAAFTHAEAGPSGIQARASEREGRAMQEYWHVDSGHASGLLSLIAVGFKEEVLRFSRSFSPPGSAPREVSTAGIPITAFGDIPSLVEESTAHVAVGRAGNTGYACLVWDDGGGFELIGQYDSPGSDFVGVAYSAFNKRIYLLDYTGERVIYAQMEATDKAMPQSWDVLATANEVPPLGDVEKYRLVLQEDGNEPLLGVIGYDNPSMDYFLIRHGIGGVWWEAVPGTRHRAGHLRTYGPEHMFHGLGLVAGTDTVNVVGPPDETVSVVRIVLDPQGVEVVGSTQVDSNGQGQVTLDPGKTFDLGEIYGAKSSCGRSRRILSTRRTSTGASSRRSIRAGSYSKSGARKACCITWGTICSE